jgi:hypothetical protein
MWLKKIRRTEKNREKHKSSNAIIISCYRVFFLIKFIPSFLAASTGIVSTSRASRSEAAASGNVGFEAVVSGIVELEAADSGNVGHEAGGSGTVELEAAGSGFVTFTSSSFSTSL